MRKTNRELITDLRSNGERCCLHELDRLRHTDVPEELRKEIEEAYRKNFRRWWDCWIEPTIKDVERRLVKDRRKKEL